MFGGLQCCQSTHIDACVLVDHLCRLGLIGRTIYLKVGKFMQSFHHLAAVSDAQEALVLAMDDGKNPVKSNGFGSHWFDRKLLRAALLDRFA